jgi:hypothetical protein
MSLHDVKPRQSCWYATREQTEQPAFSVTFTERGCVYEWETYEGVVLPFIDYGCSKKYTHHPIAVIYELMDNKSFRHLTHENLCRLVLKHASYRSTWGGFTYELTSKMGKALMDMETDPTQTAINVAIAGGVSCLCCDNLVWEGMKDERFYAVEQAYKDVVSLQGKYVSLFNPCHPSKDLPVLCNDCLKIAEKEKTNKAYEGLYQFNETNALVGLIGVLKSKIKKMQ